MSQGTLIPLNESPKPFPTNGTNANGLNVFITKNESPNRIDEISDTMYYLGWGESGVLDSEPKWKIKRIYKIDTVWYQEFANGEEFYNNIWDDRSTLIYY